MAQCRNLILTLVSAIDLPDIRNFGIMIVYANISIKAKDSKKSTNKIITPPDMKNETNPQWNFPVEYTISESSVQKPGVSILVRLYCKRTFGDKYIGEVNIPIKGLYECGLKSETIMSYNVAGTSDGKLSFLYSFGDKFLVVRKSSSWRKALELGFFVLIGGALVLLSNGDSESDDYGKIEESCEVDEVDGETFYDAN